MLQVRIVFETWKGGKTLEEAKMKLVSYQLINCHIVFDIKLDGLVQEARLVAVGHTTDVPSTITHSSVVSRDSVQIAFLIAVLNDAEVMAAGICNAYLNAP
eukprot:9558119-Ditylum_brightwellii.AAC.1